MAPGTVSTTTVFGLAATTASISASCAVMAFTEPSSSERLLRSLPSEEREPTNTTATSAAFAAAAADVASVPGL